MTNPTFDEASPGIFSETTKGKLRLDASKVLASDANLAQVEITVKVLWLLDTLTPHELKVKV